MEPIEIVRELCAIPGRGPGTDAERRAARRLAELLRESGREAEAEPVWVRPQWPLVLGMHAALGIAASVVAMSVPAVALAMLGAVLASLVLDASGRAHLLRRLSPPRATQNIVSPPTAATARGAKRVVRLVICAHYDAGRGGIVYREGVRRAVSRAQRLARGRLPGAAGLIALALVVLAAVAGARLAGAHGTAVGAVQLVPTAGLVLGLALLVDIGLSPFVPGASDPAGGAAVAIALTEALDRSPPERMGIELVLAGAGNGPSLGMRAFAQARRRRYAPEATVILNVAACGYGPPRWWTADGPLFSLRFHPRLRELAAATARAEPHLGAAPFRGHAAGAGYRARAAGFPAITVGCLDGDAWAAGSHRSADQALYVDPSSLRAALDFCLGLVARLDEDLATRRPSGAGAPGADPR